MCAIRYAYDASELLSVPVSHVNNIGGERDAKEETRARRMSHFTPSYLNSRPLEPRLKSGSIEGFRVRITGFGAQRSLEMT